MTWLILVGILLFMSSDKRPDRRFENKQFRIRLLFDSFATLGAWFFSYVLRFYVIPGGKISTDTFTFFVFLSVIAWCSTFIALYMLGLYENKPIPSRKEVSGIVKVSISEFCFIVVFYYYFCHGKISRMHLGLYMISLFFFLLYGRTLCNSFLSFSVKSGKFNLNVLLVGSGNRLLDYYKTTSTESGRNRTKIVGQYLSDGDTIEGVSPIDAPSLALAAESVNADIVVISFSDERHELEKQVINESLDLFNQQVYVIPKIPATYTGSDLTEIRKIPVIQLNYSEMSFGSKFIKRSFDLAACTFGVIVLSPLYLLIAILVKLSSKGPVFFKQKRVTNDGKVFEMLKFRSMRTDMPEGKVHWTTEDDPRVTKIGKFLRKTSLDEIPQFFNVIAGDMSLIGPRPERPELEEVFVKSIPGYYMRHRMKAGITGWAQVNGLRGNTSLEKRIEFDLYYVRNWSLWFDLKVFFLTFFKGFVNKNAY